MRFLFLLPGLVQPLLEVPDIDLGAKYNETDFEQIIRDQKVVLSDNVGIVEPKLCDPSVKQHAGFIPFVGYGENNKQFFFWLFETRNGDPKDAPLVIWLSGGPGCSSLMGLFGENGPCAVSHDGNETQPRAESWNNNANVMWVDQPAETGFSEGAYVFDEEGVKEDFFAFLQGFYAALPQYKNNLLFITGESYAGHYIPAIADRVIEGGGNFEIPLAGIAIGNGLTNPEVQYQSYIAMADDGGASEGGTTTPAVHLGKWTIRLMEAALGPCKSQIHACNNGHTGSCTAAFMLCNYGELVPYSMSGYNPYDVREKCKVPPLCYDFSGIDKFLNRADVQSQLGVSTTWGECSRMVNLLFQRDFMRSYHKLIPPMLSKGIKVLIYAGDADFICNWIGNKHWTLQLEWPGSEEFNGVEDEDVVTENNEVVARKRSSGGLTFQQIFGAGHLVPMDKPKVALDMIEAFLADAIASRKNETTPKDQTQHFIQEPYKLLVA